MNRYFFAPKKFHEGETVVVAPDELTARRKAMVIRWGRAPDDVIPHAPNYLGIGLTLTKKEPV